MPTNDIKTFLLENRVFPNVKGFNYLIDAVDCVKCGETKMMKVYEKTAQKHNATVTQVERAIRHIVSTRLDRKMFGGYVNSGEVIFYFAQN